VADFRTLTAGTRKNRKRGYLVQIRLAEVWACLGCEDSKNFLLSKKQDVVDRKIAGFVGQVLASNAIVRFHPTHYVYIYIYT